MALASAPLRSSDTSRSVALCSQSGGSAPFPPAEQGNARIHERGKDLTVMRPKRFCGWRCSVQPCFCPACKLPMTLLLISSPALSLQLQAEHRNQRAWHWDLSNRAPTT